MSVCLTTGARLTPSIAGSYLPSDHGIGRLHSVTTGAGFSFKEHGIVTTSTRPLNRTQPRRAPHRPRRMPVMHRLVSLCFGVKLVALTVYLVIGPFHPALALALTLLASLDSLWFKLTARD